MAFARQLVHHHLPVPAGEHQTFGSEDPQMVRNEILGAFGDPGQVTDAELPSLPQSGGERQSSRIGQRTGTSCAALCELEMESSSTKTLRQWEI